MLNLPGIPAAMHFVEELNSLNPTSPPNVISVFEPTYTRHSTLKPGFYFKSVMFEPKKKIKFSHLNYKVTNYVDFTPYLNFFQQFTNYLFCSKDILVTLLM